MSGIVSKRQFEKEFGPSEGGERSLSAQRVVAIRKTKRLSQGALAALMLVSPAAVRQWERGERSPSGPSVRLLQLIERDGVRALTGLSQGQP